MLLGGPGQEALPVAGQGADGGPRCTGTGALQRLVGVNEVGIGLDGGSGEALA